MGQPITILGSTAIWPTTGDTGYSAGALQTVTLLATAVKPIEGLYNTTTGLVGNLGFDDDGNLTLNGVPLGSGSVSSIAIESPNDITVTGSPITSSGIITLDLEPTGVVAGFYSAANITVDSKGRITTAASGPVPPAGTVISVSANGAQGVTTNVTDPTTTPNITVGLGDITPLSATITTGNLAFTNTNQHITADFTNLANRVAFQTSIPDGTTNVEVLPNGTGMQAKWNLNSSSDRNNTSLLTTGATQTEVFIMSDNRGTGTIHPLHMRMAGHSGPALTIATDNDVYVHNDLIVAGTITNPNLSGINTGDQTITAQGDATGVSVGTPNTLLPLTLSNTGVVAGAYTSANITVDAKGRILSAVNGTQGVWGQITGDIADQADLTQVFTDLGQATLGTGVTTLTDTVGLIALDNFILRVNAVTKAIFAPLIPTGINNAVRTFAQQDYPLANLGLVADGIYIRFVGLDETGLLTFSTNTFKNTTNILQIGYIIVKRVAGVNTFLDGSAGPRNVFTWPGFAGNTAAEIEYFTPITDIAITPNANLTVKNAAGVLKGLNINWGTSNVNERAKVASNPMSFITINPGNSLAAVLPAPGTAVQVTQYWNGAAMVPLGGPNVSSVQRFIMTIAGQVFLQVGEFAYANFADAIDAITIAPFTPIVPVDSYVEICRFASRQAATDLSNNSDAVFNSIINVSSGGGGGGAGSVTSVGISGTEGVTSLGGPITTNGVITVGLGAITPLSVVTAGNVTANTFIGSGASLTSIPNAALVNSSLTIGTTNIALGGTSTTLAGLTSVTSTTFVGDLSGNATSANNSTNTLIINDTAASASVFPTWVTGNSGGMPVKVSSTKLTFVPSTGILTAVGFAGSGAGLTGTAPGLTAGIASQVANSITFNNTGVSSGNGTTFNGSAARTVSYDTIGAPSTLGANASGTWPINISGTSSIMAQNGAASGAWDAYFTETSTATRRWVDATGGGPNETPWWFAESMKSQNPAYGLQYAHGWASNPGELNVRSINNGAFSGWYRFLNNANFNAYAPTLTGVGASGTWNINTTGSIGTQWFVTANAGFAAGAAPNGTTVLRPGGANNTGYIEFVAANGVRQGYIGNSASIGAQDAGTISYVGGNHDFWKNVLARKFVATYDGGDSPHASDGVLVTRRSGNTGTVFFGDNPNHYLHFNGTEMAVSGGILIATQGFTSNTTIFCGQTMQSMGTCTASAFVTSSDISLKSNIEPIPDSLNKLLKIRGVSYDKVDTNGNVKHDIGFIAQEVEKVLPEVVHTNEDGLKGVAYSNISAILIEAIKELNAKVEFLTNKLNSLGEK